MLNNEERPHQGLGDNAVPADRYEPSSRRWDGVLREPVYPDDATVRRVRTNSEIKWRGKLVYLNAALAGEPVGLAETADDWTVRFGPVTLGVISHRDGERLRKAPRPSCGLVDGALHRPQGPQPQRNQQQT